MSSGTLYDKVWDLHRVAELPGGSTQLFVGLHLIHEVTSPQAFSALKDKGLTVRCPERTVATVDHIVPTTSQQRPFADPLAEEMLSTLERNCQEHGIPLNNIGSGRQGIVHVIAPELGLTQPGMTVACGDSHTSTHGAFGAIAFGIGTSQVRDVLASQSLAMNKLKVRRIQVNGRLAEGVSAKDLILHVIRHLGVKGGVGYAYEFAGFAIEALSMEERMTLCNMAIEGGARCGYVNPDQVTFDYLKGRPHAPQGEAWNRAVAWWSSLATDVNATVDDEVVFDAAAIPPTVTWGITPGQGLGIDERCQALISWIQASVRLLRRPTATWISSRERRLQEFLWMSVSSAAAPMVVSAIYVLLPMWPVGARWLKASRRLWFLVRSRWRKLLKQKGWMRCSVPQVLSGGSPAARCVWR